MIRDHIAATANLLRLHTAGFEGFLFTIGPMLGGHAVEHGDLAVLWLLGVLINGYIFALNDLVDLSRDRLNPAKARSPLVTGALSERTALLWSLCLPLISVCVTSLHGWHSGAQTAFVLLLLLGGVVNLYQKMTAQPLFMDVLFAVAMAGPVAVTAWAVSGSVSPLAWSVSALLLVLSLQLNSVAGNLKDLASDRRTGFRTVAIAMGARIAADGTLVATPMYRRYCWTLFVTVIAAGSLALWTAGREVPLAAVLGAAAVAGAVAVPAVVSMHRLLQGRRRPSPRGRELYFAAGFLLFLLVVTLRAPWSALLISIIGLVLWELGFTLYWKWYWRAGRAVTVPAAA